MGFDWIKMRTDLHKDPKVLVIAMQLRDSARDMSVTCHAVVGALTLVWGTVRHHGQRVKDDLNVQMPIEMIDVMSNWPGFGAAMKHVGWIIDMAETIVFPKFFEEKNVDPTERKKLQQNNRQQKHRDKERDKSVTCHADVTQMSRTEKEKEIEKENNTHSETTEPEPKQQATEDSLTAHQHVLATYNAVAKVHARLTPKRRGQIATRLRDKNWDYVAACQKIPNSKFLNGGSKGGWEITFDWFLKPDSVQKILEGQYDDRTRGNDQFDKYEPPKADSNNDEEGF